MRSMRLRIVSAMLILLASLASGFQLASAQDTVTQDTSTQATGTQPTGAP